MTGFENTPHWTLIWHVLLLIVLIVLTLGQALGGWALVWRVFPAVAGVGAVPFLAGGVLLMAMTGWTE